MGTYGVGAIVHEAEGFGGRAKGEIVIIKTFYDENSYCCY
jgi:hypothetical protein